MSSDHAPRPLRAESPELTGLVRLRSLHPELAPAVDMQLGLLQLQRRVQGRIPTARTPPSPSVVRQRLSHGERLIELSDVPLEWSDFRLVLRQTADILRRHDSLDESSHSAIHRLLRNGDQLEPLLKAWYAETALPPDQRLPELQLHRAHLPSVLDDVLALAMKPFLARTVEGYGATPDLDEWDRPWCPFCGGAPELAVLTSRDQRQLICGRCTGRWRWRVVGCPWCGEEDPRHLSAFASPDREYRVFACNRCRRYLKAFDARAASRPVLPAVDTIATLPLDAAAVQQGYGSGELG